MVGKRRLIKATFGVVLETGLAVVVPEGQIVEISPPPAEGNRTVDILWNDKKVMMFVNDLIERSLSIDS